MDDLWLTFSGFHDLRGKTDGGAHRCRTAAQGEPLGAGDLVASQGVDARHPGASAAVGGGALAAPCPGATGTTAALAGDLRPGVQASSLAVVMARVAVPVADVNQHQGASAAGAVARLAESMGGWA